MLYAQRPDSSRSVIVRQFRSLIDRLGNRQMRLEPSIYRNPSRNFLLTFGNNLSNGTRIWPGSPKLMKQLSEPFINGLKSESTHANELEQRWNEYAVVRPKLLVDLFRQRSGRPFLAFQCECLTARHTGLPHDTTQLGPEINLAQKKRWVRLYRALECSAQRVINLADWPRVGLDSFEDQAKKYSKMKVKYGETIVDDI